MKKLIRAILLVVCLVLILAIGFIAYLTITDYKPAEREDLSISGTADRSPAVGDTITLLSFNTGYAGLGEESDFFMDGGEEVRTTEAIVEKNMAGIEDVLASGQANIYLLQEVDSGSKRSYNTLQSDIYANITGLISSYALNFKCNYVPYPLPTIGKVSSGLQTLSAFNVESAERLSLPSPFSWPVSIANLKRCLMVSYIPIEGSDKQLVVINLHLEAYDDGEGKLEQTAALWELLNEEYEKGNYVIAGGDFNQAFPGSEDTYPILDAELWTPGELLEADLPDGWYYAFDDSTPTCRLLNEPYQPLSADTQYYVIDGFICSPNVELVEMGTLNLGFSYADHNPVELTIKLG